MDAPAGQAPTILNILDEPSRAPERMHEATRVFCRERTPLTRFSWLPERAARRISNAGPLLEALISLPPEPGAEAIAQSRLHPEGVALRRWSYALFQNPERKRVRPALWVAERPAEGAAVRQADGVLLGVPDCLILGERALPVLWGVDLYVPNAQRGAGIGEALLKTWRDAHVVALGLGITDGALRLEQKLGWSLKTFQSQFRLGLSRRGRLWLEGKKLAEPEPGNSTGLLRRVGGLLTPAHLRTLMRPPALPRGESTEEVSAPEPSISGSEVPPESAAMSGGSTPFCMVNASTLAALYRLTRPALGHHLSRSEAKLAWLYPASAGFWMLGLEAGAAKAGVKHPSPGEGAKMLEGGAVVRQEQRNGIRRWFIYELFWQAGERTSLMRLLAQLRTWALTQGVDVLALRATLPVLQDALLEQGFTAWGEPERFILHGSASLLAGASPERLLAQPWHLTLGDSGNPLFQE